MSALVVRLYFIRHGETLANCAGLVVGQSDSSLTAQGKQQARQLYQYPHRWCSRNSDDNDDDDNDSHSDAHDQDSNMHWWRIYASDLKRTQHTACLVLGLLSNEDEDGDDNDHDEDVISTSHQQAYIPSTTIATDPQWQTYQTLLQQHGVRLDVRIRETAKGVCEGLPKKTPYDQAMLQWKSKHPNVTKIPHHETPDQGWNRVLHWMIHIVGDAVREQQHMSSNDHTNTEKEKDNIVLPVLAVMHAGILRTTLMRMFANTDPIVQQACAMSKDGSLEIPNMSITVVDLRVIDPKDEVWNKVSETSASDSAMGSSSSPSAPACLSPPSLDPDQLWTSKLVHLTWTGHLQGTVSGEAGNAE